MFKLPASREIKCNNFSTWLPLENRPVTAQVSSQERVGQNEANSLHIFVFVLQFLYPVIKFYDHNCITGEEEKGGSDINIYYFRNSHVFSNNKRTKKKWQLSKGAEISLGDAMLPFSPS